jgi:hypothetical protein
VFLKGQPKHVYRDIKPSNTPFGTDFTTPKFADDEAHLEAIRAAHGHGFPVLKIEYRT